MQMCQSGSAGDLSQLQHQLLECLLAPDVSESRPQSRLDFLALGSGIPVDETMELVSMLLHRIEL